MFAKQSVHSLRPSPRRERQPHLEVKYNVNDNITLLCFSVDLWHILAMKTVPDDYCQYQY